MGQRLHDQKCKDNDPQKIFGQIHVISWTALKESPGKLKIKKPQSKKPSNPAVKKKIKRKQIPNASTTMTEVNVCLDTSL